MGVGKMDSCCCSMNKYLIWGANFCVFALAVASLGVGIYALVDGEGLSDFLDALEIEEELNIIYLASIFIIVVSSFVLLITFLGCCGALKVSAFSTLQANTKENSLTSQTTEPTNFSHLHRPRADFSLA